VCEKKYEKREPEKGENLKEKGTKRRDDGNFS
jgi:hypothetical protein